MSRAAIKSRKEKIKILSGSWLKTIAMIAMLLDHFAVIFVNENDILYWILRIIGRCSFVIFTILLIEGFNHTRNRLKYAIRLLVFAFLSEIPYNIAFSGNCFYTEQQNVFFTLFLGILTIWSIDRMKNKEGKILKNILIILFCLLLSAFTNIDYGILGILAIISAYIFRKKHYWRFIFGIFINDSLILCSHGFLIAELYNGKRGFINKKWIQIIYYAIYPMHLLLFGIIKYYISLK